MMKMENLVAELNDLFDKWIKGYSPTEEDCTMMDSILETLRELRDNQLSQEFSKREEALIREKEAAVEIAVANAQKELGEKLFEKDKENELLKSRIQRLEEDKEKSINYAVSEANIKNSKEMAEKKDEIIQLRHRLEMDEEKHKGELREIKEEYEKKVKEKENEVEYYRDLKASMSTKMVGETLEQHCDTEFNRLRMTAFPNAYFEKDNEVSETGSKGDFIYRDYQDGIEFISIMFEMKNEMETTDKKHKNSDFFKELDKDRREKGCEYAVLVSMLEADNELYNQGIVDVSYKYPKMYVIRPQFFIPLITILRNSALNSIQYKKDLMLEQTKNVDIANFELELEDFKEKFGKNYELASRRFADAIVEIDKTIAHLQKTRDALVGSDRNLRLANDKLSNISVKKLTKNSPSLQPKTTA
jgi:hypothetical protein